MRRLIKWFALNDINYKKYLIIFYVICIMLPVLIIISTNEYGESSIVKTLACAVLLVFFVVFFIYDYRKKVAADWGLLEVKTEKDWIYAVKKEAENAKEAKIMTSGEGEKVTELIDMLPETCNIKLLLLDPESHYAEIIGNGEYRAFTEAVEGYMKTGKKAIEIKYYDLCPLDLTVILDDDVFQIPTTQKLADGRGIIRHYAGKKRGTAQFNDIFERVWDKPSYEMQRGERQ